jgi:glutathione synthase/RimK-type ligase-like ATP-grasp enzyme
MKKCAFLTLEERGDFVIDDEHAIAPLAMLGWEVSTLSWRQQQTPWSAFDLVVIRSTWDYWTDVAGFLDVLRSIETASLLENSLELVRWNLSKTYMKDLEQAGVGIVPTLWPGRPTAEMLQACFQELDLEELVIKPVIGANGEDAFRLSREDSRASLEGVAAFFRDKDAMIQPFMARVLTEGEFSLFYFNGEFSHAILKVPAPDEFRSQEERGAEVIPVTPEPLLLERGAQAVATISTAPLYARVDFVRDEFDDFRVMEMELIEPSMYLRTDPSAPDRFAEAIDRRYRELRP